MSSTAGSQVQCSHGGPQKPALTACYFPIIFLTRLSFSITSILSKNHSYVGRTDFSRRGLMLSQFLAKVEQRDTQPVKKGIGHSEMHVIFPEEL